MGRNLKKTMKIAVIIPAAGSGKRLGYKTAKPYIRLADKPLLAHTLAVFQETKRINQVILVVEKDNLSKAKKLSRRFNISKLKTVVAGGQTRTDSVANGIKELDSDTDYVLIHDGALPFITKGLINDCIDSVIKNKAVISAVRCVSTIKVADKKLKVLQTLDRNSLWQVQTPQAFAVNLLKKAYACKKSRKGEIFDDATFTDTKYTWPVRIRQN